MMSIMSSARWVVVAQGSRVGTQMLSLVILSRLLPPHSYGLIGMAMTITNLAFMLRDMGTMVTIVQRPALNEALTDSLFWVNVALAIVISVLMITLAEPLARVYREPELEAIVYALSLSLPLSSIGSVQQALMERNSEFRTLAQIEVTSAALGLATAILLAYNGAGVWSLIWQMLVSTAISAAQSWLISPWHPKFSFDISEMRKIYGFTTNYATFQIVTYLQKNIDSGVIGFYLGSLALGFYSMASKVVLLPIQNISIIATRVLVPAISRRQHDISEIAGLFLRANIFIFAVTAPVLSLLFYFRLHIIEAVLGSSWSPIGELLIWLIPAAFVQSLHAPATAVLVGSGRANTLLKLSLFSSLTQLICMVFATAWGLQGVAIGYLVASTVNFFPTIARVFVLLNVKPLRFLYSFAKPLVATSVMFLVLHLIDLTFTGTRPLSNFDLIGNITAALAVYFACLIATMSRGMSILRNFVRIHKSE